jgi:MFS family permease
MCDLIGRRPTILSGLALYLLASLVALFSASFSVLLAARMLAAFGAAVGSVGTQTAIRDRFDGYELARVFSVMGIAMAISPAIGVLSGALLTHYWGYQGVFGGLALLAHPARYRLPHRRLIAAAADLGFDGAEVWYDYAMRPRWQPTELVCEAIAADLERRGLLMSCGTDTHGLVLHGR